MHIPFYITLMRLLGGLRNGWRDPEFRALLIFVLILLLTGTVFYSQVEHWSLLDSLYFSITTLTTVGFGDLAPKTDVGKIFTIIYIIIGVGTILSFVTLLAQHSRESDPIHKHFSKDKEEDIIK
jgi:voltage-gated potassium channel